jgi:hypothetical protein
VTPDEYCREIEAYLCRKNDGHLIRLVGPSFECVRRWESSGIPFKIACQGIDRYFVRYYAKGSRRRPVQIEFCDADVLDAFDVWRRAVGVRLPGTAPAEAESARRQRRSLPEHLIRVCERITGRLAGRVPPAGDLGRVLETIANEASSFGDLPAPIRGETRARVSTRLAELDRMMLDAVRKQSDEPTIQALRQEAARDLAPFKERMPADAFERAIDAVVDRLLRDREQLPSVTFE